LPAGASFTDNGNGTGTFEWLTDFTSSVGSPYSVHFTVSDGLDTDTANCKITVSNINRPVTLDPIGNKSAIEGQQITFNVIASDPDGAPQINVSNLPPGAQIGLVQPGVI